MEFFRQLLIDGDTSLSELLHEAYSRGGCVGYKEKSVAFDWIDEGFDAFIAERFQVKKEEGKHV